MKLPVEYKLKDIASIIEAEYIGPDDHIVSGLNEIHRVEKGDLLFVDHPKYFAKALKSAATTILINKMVDCPSGKALLISNDPFRDYNSLVSFFMPNVLSRKNISDSAKIGSNTTILPGVYIGHNVKIGSNCVIHPNVVIYNDCLIGDNVIIHAGCVIGADAFYYKKRSDKFDKLISCGRVIIQDHVEIGALSTIDRGVSADTVIGKGTKIDNHVQIGHDTIVGEMCLFASQVGISGAVTIEDGVTLWGQVGVPSDVVIGKGAVVLGQSGLSGSIAPNSTYFGSPAVEARVKMKELVMLKRIPELIDKINRLEGKIRENNQA
jgi:UDP-3-O-[3-hydroxymyristoyl] glucosamine N-acyltransferase